MPNLKRRNVIGMLAAALLPWGTRAQSSSYPTRPVELIAPYPAGGGTDVLARALALSASKHFPQPLIVVNKPGAAGVVGWGDTLRGDDPGYKMVVLASALMTMPLLGLSKYTYRDFTPIAQLNYDPAALTVRADAPWKDVDEFLAAAKKTEFRVGNGGDGSIWHLAAAAIAEQAGVSFNHIPFAGANPAVLSLLGGHIDAITVSAAEVYNQVAGGKLRILGVMSENRRKGFENIPTLREGGLDIAMGVWRGLAVPASTPDTVVAMLRSATAKAVQEPVFQEALAKQSLGFDYADGEAFSAIMERDHELYVRLIDRLGLTKK